MRHPFIITLENLLKRSQEQDPNKFDRAMTRKTSLHNFQINSENGVIEAFCPGEHSGDIYKVKIDLGLNKRNCTCPAHKHYPTSCKHVVALASLAKDFLTIIE
jgi:uncharacterized Zn finger protein